MSESILWGLIEAQKGKVVSASAVEKLQSAWGFNKNIKPRDKQETKLHKFLWSYYLFAWAYVLPSVQLLCQTSKFVATNKAVVCLI